MPRLFVAAPLHAGAAFALDAAAARHVQVLRLQPGDALTLFDGRGGEWSASVHAMARRSVEVQLLEHHAVERELAQHVTLALAMPAGDRMEVVVEKAVELGAAAIQPLVAERSVLRLAGERAQRRQAHWQAIAVAACEQCGRNRVPQVQAPQALSAWLGTLGPPADGEQRRLLGWRAATPWPATSAAERLVTLSGPEGGFTDDEQQQAMALGFAVHSLGPRVLRADTAPLAALAALSLMLPR